MNGSPLLSEDASSRAGAFEEAVLEALELDPLKVSQDRLARAYVWLSDRLNRGTMEPSALAESDVVEADDVAAVFGLVYGARSFHVAHRLLAHYPPPPGPIVEVGAGWGPFALVASLMTRRRATLVDVSEAALRRASRLFAAAGAPAPELVTGSATELFGSFGTIAAPFSLGEMESPEKQVARWSAQLTHQGHLYILEPGTRRSALPLQAIRDAPPRNAHVIAPCTGAPTCPMLERPNDWCHFTWRGAQGPLARAVAEKARRRWQEQHVSFLILGRAGAPTEALRLLDLRPHGRAKLTARACGPEGLVTLTALRRHRNAYDVLQKLEPGALISVEGAESKGDGLRIGSTSSVRIIRPL